MLSRLRRAVWTFLAVAGAYLAYNLLAVPFIEPSVTGRSSLLGTAANGTVNTARKLRAARLEALFSAGDWELDNPMVLETDRGMLLIRDYQNQADGSLELKPCTLILYDASRASDAEDRGQRCLLLRSPQGAVLHFDRPMDLALGQFGRLVGGWLVGPVTISSSETSPGADDALDIRTGSVQISRQRITAPQEVIFRYGPNTGRGRDLIIDLDLPGGTRRRSAPTSETPFGQIRSLELVHVENLQLQLEDPRRAAADGKLPPADEPIPVKVEITCQGPFRFDLARSVATLEDQVLVRRKNLDGPDDLLRCDRASIYFGAPPAMEKPGATAAKSRQSAAKHPRAEGLPEVSKLHIQRLVIEGSPAVMDAPSEGIAARAGLVEYSFASGLVRVIDRGRAQLRYGENEFEAASVEYTPSEEPGRLGRLLASGPGRLRGVARDEPDQVFEATWRDRLIIQPHLGDHAVSLLGGARVRHPVMGEFAADALHVWLHETPREAPPGEPPSEMPRFTYQPVRMLAERAVSLDSPQLTAQTQKVELWIRYADKVTAAAAPPKSARSAAQVDQAPTEQKSAQRFDMLGDHLQVQVLRDDRQAVVEHAILEGNVRLRELQTAKPGEVPLNVAGDLVQIESANTPRTRLRIQGSPAEVAARGLAATGGNIQLNREHNSLWILGPGTMTLPVPADRLASPSGSASESQTPPATIPLTVQWQDRMIFDGLVATFERQVQLHGRQQTTDGQEFNLLAMGGELAVTLNRRIDFSASTPPDAEVDQALFRGTVRLQNTAHRLGVPTSIDRMEIRDLSLNPQSGRLQAFGPGWGTSVRVAQQLPGSARISQAGREEQLAKLAFVRVDFEDQLVGDIHRRDLEFRGRVRTLYGPVERWQDELDPEPRGGLDEGVFLLTSQRLGLAQMRPTSDDEAAEVEVVAEGNATVEGTNFSARGWRISYAGTKELLILEGDGRSDAELWMKGSTTPDAAAQQIRFWTNKNSIQVDRGRFFNLGQLGGLPR